MNESQSGIRGAYAAIQMRIDSAYRELGALQEVCPHPDATSQEEIWEAQRWTLYDCPDCGKQWEVKRSD